MAYRDVSESLRAYRERVAADLEDARRAAQEAAERAARVKVLEKELAETDGLLAKVGGGPRKLPLLDAVSIAAPCTASWEQMVGDEHVRFCGQCEKNVYNLSSLPREEAEALLLAKEGNMCVRLFRRADGTVLTSDCPVGVKKRRRRRAVVTTVGGGLMAMAAVLGTESQRTQLGGLAPATMGDLATTAETTAATTTLTAPTFIDPPGGEGQWLGGAVAIPREPTQKTSKTTKAVPIKPVMGKVQVKE
jgi:hypothetical protein